MASVSVLVVSHAGLCTGMLILCKIYSCRSKVNLVLYVAENKQNEFAVIGVSFFFIFGELEQTTTTATRTSPNKRVNEENNSCARAL